MPHDPNLLRRFHRIRLFNGSKTDASSVKVQPKTPAGVAIGDEVDGGAVPKGTGLVLNFVPASPGAFNLVGRVSVTVKFGDAPARTLEMLRSVGSATIRDVDVTFEEPSDPAKPIGVKAIAVSAYGDGTEATEADWRDDDTPVLRKAKDKDGGAATSLAKSRRRK